MKHDIFISYSRKDATLVKKICSKLRKKHISYWIDDQIMLGNDFRERIAHAIYESNIFLFIWTTTSNESENTAKEIGVALEYEKPIISFRVGNFMADFKLAYDLPRLNRIDAPDCNNVDASIDELINKLNSNSAISEKKRKEITNTKSTDFLCHIGKKITPEMIEQALHIDELVYPERFRGIREQCFRWYQKNPEIYVMIEDTVNQKIIGYINAMPLEPEAYERFKSGEDIDIYISEKSIRTYQFPDFYYLYFSSIAIHPDYQNTTAFKILFDCFLNQICSLAEREVYIVEMLADAVSDDGEKLCKLAGMAPLISSRHNSNLFQTTLLPPSMRVTTIAGKKVIKLYKEIYKTIQDIL